MRASYLFTSESVSEGHPDKVCDRISDEIVDLFFREGPKAGIDPWAIRAACETLATTNKVVIAGETRGPKSVTHEQIEGVVRAAIKDIGYEQEGFHWNTCDIEVLLHPQSADIAQGVGALPREWINGKPIWHITPTGKFYIGGPDGDPGLPGRKIIVDTYGGAAPHGGGAFSGKDPTKVDRSAAYAARYLAKNIVAAGLAERCTLQLAYAIGVARPLSLYINTHGTGNVPEDKLEKAVAEATDLTPRRIRMHLDLNRPIYARTSSYGHFGRTPDNEGGFSWEKTDLAETLKRPV